MSQPPTAAAGVDEPTEAPANGRSWPRLVVFAAVIGVLLFFARSLGDQIPAFAAWVEGLGIWGPVVYIAGYAVATVLFVPGSLLTLAGGAIFGIGKGTAIVFLGASIGATLSFLVARYFARSAIERKVEGNARFAAIDRAIAGEGRKITFLLRLTPALPFNLLNYALGLTKVRLVDYIIACFGMLPGTLLYVYYGKVAGDITALAAGAGPERDGKQYALLGVGLVAAIAVTTVVTRIARRALAEASAESADDGA